MFGIKPEPEHDWSDSVIAFFNALAEDPTHEKNASRLLEIRKSHPLSYKKAVESLWQKDGSKYGPIIAKMDILSKGGKVL